MTYISKGFELNGSNNRYVKIHYYGGRYELKGIYASLWRRGIQGIASAVSMKEENIIYELEKQGLVKVAASANGREWYFLLSRCLICLPKRCARLIILNSYERRVLTWLRKSGFRLNISELIYLIENNIQPSRSLLGEKNGRALSRRIYQNDHIQIGNSFERKMSVVLSRDSVVNAVIQLIRKKQIYII